MNNKKKLNNELSTASRNGNLKKVKTLVDKGADIHVNDNYPLIIASYWGYLDIVQYLVEKGADIHAKNDDALINALINASEQGHLKIVKFFIVEYGYDPLIAINIAKEKVQNEVVDWCESYINAKELNNKLEKSLKLDKINNKKMKV